jgi:hypothetical protein
MTEEKTYKEKIEFYQADMQLLSQQIMSNFDELHTLKWYQIIKNYQLTKEIELLREQLTYLSHRYSRLLLRGKEE